MSICSLNLLLLLINHLPRPDLLPRQFQLSELVIVATDVLLFTTEELVNPLHSSNYPFNLPRIPPVLVKRKIKRWTQLYVI